MLTYAYKCYQCSATAEYFLPISGTPNKRIFCKGTEGFEKYMLGKHFQLDQQLQREKKGNQNKNQG